VRARGGSLGSLWRRLDAMGNRECVELDCMVRIRVCLGLDCVSKNMTECCNINCYRDCWSLGVRYHRPNQHMLSQWRRVINCRMKTRLTVGFDLPMSVFENET